MVSAIGRSHGNKGIYISQVTAILNKLLTITYQYPVLRLHMLLQLSDAINTHAALLRQRGRVVLSLCL